MPVARHFLGWDAPIREKVRDFLLPRRISGPVDLDSDLIVVPTAQAGRRLREALALECARHDTALLSAQTVLPSFFLRRDDDQVAVADATVVKAVWAELLVGLGRGECRHLFPAATDSDFGWALQAGEMIERLRGELADGGYRISDVVEKHAADLEELDRWKDLANLENACLKRLAGMGLSDPGIREMSVAASFPLPENKKRIVVAAVPDPSLLTIRALKRLSEDVPVVVLIHAPESLSDHFDDWGRPLPEKWAREQIDIPDPDRNVVLAASPASEARKVLEIISSESRGLGQDDIGIGVPDRTVIPFLETELGRAGLSAFDPSDKPLTGHPLYRLLEPFCGLITGGSYSAVSSLLRHPDMLAFLKEKYRLSPLSVLTELDEFQNDCLPLDLRDIARQFGRDRSGIGAKHGGFTNLEKAVAFLQERVDASEKTDLADSVRSLLLAVYEMREVRSADPADDEFRKVSKIVDEILHEFAGGSFRNLKVENEQAAQLFLRSLADKWYHVGRNEPAIDLEGWLELPWNDAPLLIVTGMNEGSVPDSQTGDVFLPDSLRSRLDLRDDSWRLARDAFLMRGLIESRRGGERRSCFVAAKTGCAGDPLKPSRLLFRCADRELPARARRLFGPADENHGNWPSTICFKLNAGLPPDVPSGRRKLERIPVTAFRDYLACPFRFYLKHVLQMEPLDDDKRSMDATEFGSMVHDILERLGADHDLRGSDNESALWAFVSSQADEWVKERFGTTSPLTVKIQVEAARQRLGQAVRRQVELVREGWEIQQAEKKYEMEICGVIVSGKIDRIDRHRETGRLRIIDYKTSDKPGDPEAAHLGRPSEDTPDFAKVSVGGKEKRWTDLQLPLYRMMISADARFSGTADLCYFNLPRAVADTGLCVWKSFTDHVFESAIACSGSVVEAIKAGAYWPPAAKVDREDFKDLIYDDAKKCFEPLRAGGGGKAASRRRGR